MTTPLNLVVPAVILGPSPKRPGVTRSGGYVLGIEVSINGARHELNLVTKPNQTIEEALDYLTKAGFITKNGNEYVIQVPVWALNKARGNTIWVHVEDYEKLKGTTG